MTAERVTLRQIAEAAGVSVSTASRVLRGAPGISADRRKQVMVQADRLGWAADTARPRITVLSAIDPGAHDAPDFQTELLAGITATAQELDIAVTVRLIAPEADLPADLLPDPQGGSHGVLLLSLDHNTLIEALDRRGLAVVMVNGADLQGRLSSASAANRSGGYVACRHLLGLGHRQILRLTHDRRQPVRDRFAGADLALAEAGLRHDPRRNAGLEHMRAGDAFRAVSAALKADPTITAIQSCNDAAAMGAIAAAVAMGRQVPGDLSVIGFDDIPAAALSSPPLTTVTVPRHKIGAESVRLLMRRMQDPATVPVNAEIAGQLILRGSTAAPPQTASGQATTPQASPC